jgi:hypothetical protein
MKKLYNFRLDTLLIKEIENRTDNKTLFVTNALKNALQNDPYGKGDVNTDYIQHLNEEIQYLRDLHKNTMNRVLYLPENKKDREHREPVNDNTPIKDVSSSESPLCQSSDKENGIHQTIDKTLLSLNKDTMEKPKKSLWSRFRM